MYRPINWLVVALSLCCYALGMSLRDKPATVATFVRPPVELVRAPVFSQPASRSEPLTFGRIPADSKETDSSLLVRTHADGIAL
jgi:hypothetical protein